MMNDFELNIYGDNDEIIKTYSTAHIRWGIFADAIKLKEEIANKDTTEQLEAVSNFMKKIFLGLTDEHMQLADVFDVFNTFNMIVNKANSIKGGGKNG